MNISLTDLIAIKDEVAKGNAEAVRKVIDDLIEKERSRVHASLTDKLEIPRMIVLSTSHLTEKACNDFLPTYIHAYSKADYGWFVYVEPAPDGLPDSLIACLQFAHELGCEWVMFDRDADPISVLPSYSW